MIRRTRIIATLGPATDGSGILADLIRAGMDAARFNFSHGSHEEHHRRIVLLRREAARAGKQIALIQDLQGPKIRLGELPDEGVPIRRGQEITLTARELTGTQETVTVRHERLARDVNVGNRILIDDGRIELRVLKKTGGDCRCRVVSGGILKSRKGVNFPDTKLSLPSLTAKDHRDIQFGISEGFDYVALSFVRSANDIRQIRKYLRRHGASTPIIAKIEKPEAIANLDPIIAESDAIMVARGDLGVEMSPEKVPLLQKQIINHCNRIGKPVITATQMLESMIEKSQPTRAEASDVANAILDGSDCVMLSGETAAGKYPVASVRVMARIALQTEKSSRRAKHELPVRGIEESVAQAACRVAEQLKARAVAAFTRSGATATLVSKHRPGTMLIAATPDEAIMRRLALYYGITPILMDIEKTTDDMIDSLCRLLLQKRMVRKQDLIVITAGAPIGEKSTTNMMRVQRIGR